MQLIKITAITAIFILMCALSSCGSDQIRVRDDANGSDTKLAKQGLVYPEDEIDTSIEPAIEPRTQVRYYDMIIEPVNRYHRYNGKLPATLTEFFNSDFCFVHPMEITTGKLFEEANQLDEQHPEKLVYNVVDDDTGSISYLLIAADGTPHVETYNWSREKFWGFFPRDEEGKDAEEWAEREKKKPPRTTKKAKEMLAQFNVIFVHALAEYYDSHNDFPADFDSLFAEKWGTFRREPWRNFEYDDPERKLPNRIIGFDKTRKAYYVKILSETGLPEYEYARQLPVNFVEEEGRPVIMSPIVDISSLDIEIFADAEILRSL